MSNKAAGTAAEAAPHSRSHPRPVTPEVERSPRPLPRPRYVSSVPLGCCYFSDLALHVLGLHDVLVHAELLGIESQGQPDHLRKVKYRQPQVALYVLRRVVLLHVEVEVAERAWGDHAVRIRVDRVGDVPSRLTQ